VVERLASVSDQDGYIRIELRLTISLTAVVASVAAIVSALNDGANLIVDYQKKWSEPQDERQSRHQQQDEQKIITLQRTFSAGSHRIRERYNEFYLERRLPFASGDSKSS